MTNIFVNSFAMLNSLRKSRADPTCRDQHNLNKKMCYFLPSKFADYQANMGLSISFYFFDSLSLSFSLSLSLSYTNTHDMLVQSKPSKGGPFVGSC